MLEGMVLPPSCGGKVGCVCFKLLHSCPASHYLGATPCHPYRRALQVNTFKPIPRITPGGPLTGRNQEQAKCASLWPVYAQFVAILPQVLSSAAKESHIPLARKLLSPDQLVFKTNGLCASRDS